MLKKIIIIVLIITLIISKIMFIDYSRASKNLKPIFALHLSQGIKTSIYYGFGYLIVKKISSDQNGFHESYKFILGWSYLN